MQLTIVIFLIILSPSFGVRVDTIYGPIEGETLALANGQQANAFRGIPFAKPPIGDLRFKRPSSPDQWIQPRNTKAFPNACIQSMPIIDGAMQDEQQSEDCLYLNVFSLATASRDFFYGYPVMVWIHGGAFILGSAKEYGMNGILEYLVTKQVIVVTIQYRLGIFGFLSSGDTVAPGNWGLWDQTLALKWVKNNILYFGGDPNKVTIFGESAGSASVSALTISHYSSGLFNQAIEMSGSIFAPWASYNNSLMATKYRKFGNLVGCKRNSSVERINCIITRSTNDIKNAAVELQTFDNMLGGWGLGPVKDKIFFPEDSFENLLKISPPKPTLAGVTSLEAGLFLSAILKGASLEPRGNFDLNLIWGVIDKALNEINMGDSSQKIVKPLINQTYFSENSNNRVDLIYNLTQLLSDLMIVEPTYKDVQLKFDNKWPVWLYQFDYYKETSFAQDSVLRKGAFHASELPYLFGITKKMFGLSSFDPMNANDVAVLSDLTTLWTNFAKYGEPTPVSVNGVKWSKLTKEWPSRYLQIKPRLEMKPKFDTRITDFWLNTVPTIRRWFGSEGL